MNFIKKYDNVFSNDFCNHVINTMNNNETEHVISHKINYESLNMQETSYFKNNVVNALVQYCKDNECVALAGSSNNLYNFDNYKTVSDQTICNHILGFLEIPNYMKVIKYKKYEGHHKLWHCDNNANKQDSYLTMYIFLNDIEIGGTIDFHQFERNAINPTMGSILVIPSSFEYVHHINIPLSNNMYIIKITLCIKK